MANDEDKVDPNKFQISWHHIVTAAKHELFPRMGMDMDIVVERLKNKKKLKMTDLSESAVDEVIECLKDKRNNMTASQVAYIQKMVSRAISFMMKSDDTETQQDEKDQNKEAKVLSDEFKGLNSESLFDVFTLHKMHCFSFQQKADYSVTVFQDDVRKADEKIFGDVGLSDFVDTVGFKQKLSKTSFYPYWLCNDDIFEVIPLIYGVNEFVNMLKNEKANNISKIRSFIIPKNGVISIYDEERQIKEDMNSKSIDAFLREKHVQHNGSLWISHKVEEGKVDKFVKSVTKRIECLWNAVKDDETAEEIVVIFDRRECDDSGSQSIWLFECSNTNLLKDLQTSYVLGFDYEFGMNNVMRSYLNFGDDLKVRFYPEFITSFLPRIFVATPTINQWKTLKKLYGDDYKKGWTVDLSDSDFNKIYKAVTGCNHETNNYRRENMKHIDEEQRRFGLFQFIEYHLKTHLTALKHLRAYTEEHAFDSDGLLDDLFPELDRVQKKGYFVAEHDSNIAESVRGKVGRRGWMALKSALFRWKNIECKEEHELKLRHCPLMEGLVANLKTFQEEQYEVEASNVFEFELSEVIQGFDHLISVHKIFQSEKVHEIIEYITKHVSCIDPAQCEVSRMHRERKREIINQKRSDHKKKADKIETLCEALSDSLSSAHCYLLHRNSNILYRLSPDGDGADSRFSSAVQTEETKDDETPENHSSLKTQGVDFGVSVLEWLPFGEKPEFDSLRTEIVENKESTIDEPLYEHYLLKCIEKLEGEHTDYTIDEMMGLKLFTDSTEYQALLRKAHWTITLLDIRKAFYHWARAIYMAALRHSVPIPSVNQRMPRSLYHGLTQLFTVGQELPIYHGPFSSTIARTVADTFCGGDGLMFHIQPSYTNAETCCFGIDMVTISGFKHEHEILLVNQVIPIQKATTTKIKDDDVMLDHFLSTVKSRGKEVVDKAKFFKRFGVDFNPNWIPKICQRRNILFQETKFEKRLILERLVEEFDLKELLEDLKEHFFVISSRFVVKTLEQEEERYQTFHEMQPTQRSKFEALGLDKETMDRCVDDTKYKMDSHPIQYRAWRAVAGKHEVYCQNERLFGDRWICLQILDLKQTIFNVDADNMMFNAEGNLSPFSVLKEGQLLMWSSYFIESHLYRKKAIVRNLKDDEVLIQFLNPQLGQRLMKRDDCSEKMKIWWEWNSGSYCFGVGFGDGSNIYDENTLDAVAYAAGGTRLSLRKTFATNIETSKVTLYAKPRSHSENRSRYSEWFPITTLDNPLSCAPDYIFGQQESVVIEKQMKLFQFVEEVETSTFQKKYGNGGKMRIVSLGDIIVGSQGAIDGSGCGLQRGTKFKNDTIPKYGELISNLEGQEVSEEEKGAGGGIITLASCASIRNNGKLRCAPSKKDVFSGGTVQIICSGILENNGVIDCGNDGRVQISCRDFVNTGITNPAPTITLHQPIQCPNEVNIFIMALMSTAEKIDSLTEFYKKANVQFRIDWIPHILNHPLLLELTPYLAYMRRQGKYSQQCVLDRIVRELKIEELLYHYLVYRSHFEMCRSSLYDGIFLDMKIVDEVEGFDSVDKDTLNEHFAATKFRTKGATISGDTTFVDLSVGEIIVKNETLFGDRIIWQRSFGEKETDIQNVNRRMVARIGFSEVLAINKDEVISCDAAILSVNEDVVMGQQVTFLRTGSWHSGAVSRVLNDKICVSSVTERLIKFEWIKRAEFPLRLHRAFKGEEDLRDHVFALGISRPGDEENVVPTSRGFVFETAKDVALPLHCVVSKADHSCRVHVFAKPHPQFKKDVIKAEWEFQLIASLQHKVQFPLGPQSIINEMSPQSIDDDVHLPNFIERYGTGGSLQVASVSAIVIRNKTMIDGRGRGQSATINPQIKSCLKIGALHPKSQKTIEENIEGLRCPKDHKMRATTVSRRTTDFTCKDCSKTLNFGSDGYQCDHSECKFQLCMNCFEARVIPEDFQGAGGGAVSLISCNGVINNGTIECTASNDNIFGGGSVMVRTERRFENNGIIDCGSVGTVVIECSEFVNNGSIGTTPTVLIQDDRRMMPWIRAMTSHFKEEPIQLTVKRWRGHNGNREMYHPRNLLVKEIKSKLGYLSDYSAPANEDWITFGVAEEARIIPTKVCIRNCTIKRVAICGGRNSVEFDDWIRIDRIRITKQEILCKTLFRVQGSGVQGLGV